MVGNSQVPPSCCRQKQKCPKDAVSPRWDTPEALRPQPRVTRSRKGSRAVRRLCLGSRRNRTAPSATEPAVRERPQAGVPSKPSADEQRPSWGQGRGRLPGKTRAVCHPGGQAIQPTLLVRRWRLWNGRTKPRPCIPPQEGPRPLLGPQPVRLQVTPQSRWRVGPAWRWVLCLGPVSGWHGGILPGSATQ